MLTQADGFYYGTMQATPWQDKDKLKALLFDLNGFDRDITIKYLDIPSLHTFDDEGCKFMTLLASTDELELFL
jgi:hypothetical protein